MSGVKKNFCAGVNGKACRNQPEKTGGITMRTADSRKTRRRYYCRACLPVIKQAINANAKEDQP